MQCTLDYLSSAIPTDYPAVLGMPTSVAAALADGPDPRRHASVTSALPAILALAIVALLCNHRSVLAIAQWGQRQPPEPLRRLGFPTGRVPCQSTLQRLFAKLDGAALAAVLAAHFASAARPVPAPAEPQGVSIDGKAQRGRLRFRPGGCPGHALTAFCHDHGVVLAHEPSDPATAPGEKHEAELTVAPALIAQLPWAGRVLTGDARFGQRNLCQQVLAADGHYLLGVNDNQAQLHADIRLVFDPPAEETPLPLVDRREATTLERGHGRQEDRRHLMASTDLTNYLDWPGLAQVFRLERTWRIHGQTKREVHDGITSLPPHLGPPDRLLARKRGHWAIEHQLHWVKDVTLGEDASLIHQGQGPTVLAVLRETALSLLRRAGVRQIAARLRDHAQQPEPARALLCNPPPTRA